MNYTAGEISWICLSAVNGMTSRRFYRLLTACEEPQEVWDEPEAFQEDMDAPVYEALIKFKAEGADKAYIDSLDKLGITALTRDSEGYPQALQHIHDAPPTLYVKGNTDLESDRNFAVVGTRNPTYDGQKAAREFTAGLAKHGVSVVSGLARGVDSLAHTACLDAGGHTIAVLGNGLASVYPPENARLAARILESGGSVVSEMRPSDTPTRWSFPQRNRIISALSLGTLVVEGSRKSGAMITAGFALDEGKDVFAVPGSPFSEASEGTNMLIQNGAYPVLSHWDILESMHWETRPSTKKITSSKPPELSPTEKKLYDALKNQPLSFDEIQNVTLFSASQLNSCLTMLLLRGIIVKLPGNIYRRA